MEKYINRGIYFILYLLALLPLLPQAVMSGAIVLLVLFGMIKMSLTYNDNGYWKDFKTLLIVITPYLLYGFSAFYSEDKIETVKLIQRQIPLILMPLSFYYVRGILNENILNKIFVLNILSCFVLVSKTWIQFGLETTSGNIQMGSFIVQKIGTHASYISLMILMSLLMLTWLLFRVKKQIPWYGIIALVGMVVLFVLTIVLLSSRMALVLMLLLVPIFTWTQMRRVKMKLIVVFGFVALVLICLPLSNRMLNKIEDIQTADKTLPVEQDNGKKNPRLRIYKNTFELILDNWFWGIGMGDQKSALINQYQSDDFDFGVKQEFNTHNQFLSFWLASGIVCMLLFAFSILWQMYQSIVHKDGLMFILLLLISSFFLTENILQRQMGIVIYSFYSSLFLWYRKNKEGRRWVRCRTKRKIILLIIRII